MKSSSYFFFSLIVFFCISLNTYSQALTAEQKDKITSEVTLAFEKSIQSAESLDAAISDCVDDSLKAGFIINGNYFHSFDEVMKDFEQSAKGCEYQRMSVINKKITVLGEDSALLTASGSYSLKLEDGRTLSGKFAWTLVYLKVKGNWKIIYTHMGNPPK